MKIFNIIFMVGICFSNEIKMVDYPCTNTLLVGWEPWEPYQYRNDERQIAGFDVELIRTIMDVMECDIEFVETSWSAQLQWLKHGELHLAIGASYSKERERYAYFSNPFRTEQVKLFVRKGLETKYKFTKLADIINSDFKLGVTKGYYYGDEYEQLSKLPEFQQHQVNTDIQHIRMTVTNRIDGFIMDDIVAIVQIYNDDLQDQIVIYPMDIYSCDIHIMFSKESVTRQFVEGFNVVLQTIKDNGVYNNLLKKYSGSIRVGDK